MFSTHWHSEGGTLYEANRLTIAYVGGQEGDDRETRRMSARNQLPVDLGQRYSQTATPDAGTRAFEVPLSAADIGASEQTGSDTQGRRSSSMPNRDTPKAMRLYGTIPWSGSNET